MNRRRNLRLILSSSKMKEEDSKPNEDEGSANDETEQAHFDLGDHNAHIEVPDSADLDEDLDELDDTDHDPYDCEGYRAFEAEYGSSADTEHEANKELVVDTDVSSQETLIEDSEGDEASKGMSFLAHLEEFRWTIGRSLIAFVVGLVLATIFMTDIMSFLNKPIIAAYGSVELFDQELITKGPMDVISVYIQVAFMSGFTLSMPFLLFFLGNFVAPGLTEQERRILTPSCLTAFVLFLLGITFAFFVILPLTLGFSVRLNQYFGFELLWAALDYYSMVVWSSLVTGVFFQFPLVIVILIFLQVISVMHLKRIRKIVFVVIMILGAIMSPGGDFVSLPLTTGFMYALYELAIGIGAYIERKNQLKEAE